MKPLNFNFLRRSYWAVLVVASLMLSASVVCADEGDAAERLFTLKVLPLLKEKCLGCHGNDAQDIKGEYSIVDREQLLRGGESGDVAVVPGK
ncbi:MAG: hypothetical protein KDA69_21820, partial [Planctomycetaceae bacterium]|nr:hypothetical protein [Planctomycetaceae bacterium]